MMFLTSRQRSFDDLWWLCPLFGLIGDVFVLIGDWYGQWILGGLNK